MHEEAELLLRYELRDLSAYNSIIKAIAAGYANLHELSQKSYIEKHKIIRYIDILTGLEIIKKELPHLSSKKEKLKENNFIIFDINDF